MKHARSADFILDNSDTGFWTIELPTELSQKLREERFKDVSVEELGVIATRIALRERFLSIATSPRPPHIQDMYDRLAQEESSVTQDTPKEYNH